MTTLETPFIYKIVNTHTITKYSVEFINLILHKEITLLIHLFNDEIVKTIQYKIEGEEYDAWGLDDSYLERLADKYVKEFFNIAEPIEEPTEPIEEPTE
jgi:hypothetical protein